MKKLIVGALVLGAVMALRPAVKRRMVEKMSAHCKQMMAQFAAGDEATGQEAMPQKMREHCAPMGAQHEQRAEPVAAG